MPSDGLLGAFVRRLLSFPLTLSRAVLPRSMACNLVAAAFLDTLFAAPFACLAPSSMEPATAPLPFLGVLGALDGDGASAMRVEPATTKGEETPGDLSRIATQV